jgi:hypothetical protein
MAFPSLGRGVTRGNKKQQIKYNKEMEERANKIKEGRRNPTTLADRLGARVDCFPTRAVK